ncbi:MAG: cache domain-containing protein [Syntrophales bacterium]
MTKNQLHSRMRNGGIILVLIAALVIGGFSPTKPADTLIDLSAAQSILIARSISTQVRHALKEEMGLAAAMAGEANVIAAAAKIRESGAAAARAEIAAAQRYLSAVAEKSGSGFERFAFLDADGTIFAGGQAGLSAAPGASTREAFADMTTRRQIGVGGVVQSPQTGEIMADVCVPIFDRRGTLAGGVRGSVNISSLLARNRAGSGYALLADATGQVIADARRNPAERQELRGLGSRMVSEKSGHEFYADQGEQRHVGFAPVLLTSWSIGFSRQAAETIATARSIGFFLAGMLLILLMAMVFPRSPQRLWSAPDSAPRTANDLQKGLEQVASLAARML